MSNRLGSGRADEQLPHVFPGAIRVFQACPHVDQPCSAPARVSAAMREAVFYAFARGRQEIGLVDELEAGIYAVDM